MVRGEAAPGEVKGRRRCSTLLHESQVNVQNLDAPYHQTGLAMNHRFGVELFTDKPHSGRSAVPAKHPVNIRKIANPLIRCARG